MRVLVCGSRTFNNYAKLCNVLDDLNLDEKQPITIIGGEARGADTLGKRYAEECGYNYEGYPAQWNTYGKRAGPIRNRQMLVEGKPDLVVAFLGPVAVQEFNYGLSDSKYSPGTKDMINQSKEADVPVKVIEI